MERLKTFALYLFWFVLFFVFSRIIIFIGIHNTYNNINLKGECPDEVSINLAAATSVNGKIKGTLSEEISSKYVKFNFYTDNNNLMDSYYISTSQFQNKDFEFYFKLNHIKYYSVELTNNISEDNNSNSQNFSDKEFDKAVILAAFLMLIFF